MRGRPRSVGSRTPARAGPPTQIAEIRLIFTHVFANRTWRVTDSLNGQISTFLQNVVQAMGLSLNLSVEEGDDGTRINLEGEDGGVLVRRGGEGLQALQHLVATAFRRQLGDDNRIV